MNHSSAYQSENLLCRSTEFPNNFQMDPDYKGPAYDAVVRIPGDGRIHYGTGTVDEAAEVDSTSPSVLQWVPKRRRERTHCRLFLQLYYEGQVKLPMRRL